MSGCERRKRRAFTKHFLNSLRAELPAALPVGERDVIALSHRKPPGGIVTSDNKNDRPTARKDKPHDETESQITRSRRGDP